MQVRDISAAHVIRVIEPIGASKTETASRVRSRIELVLDYATAHGLRQGPNPARWRGNLDAALPKRSEVAKVEHHAAVALTQASAFMLRLRQQPGIGARALEFVILTATRSGGVRGATWGEVDMKLGLSTVPAARMKGVREHGVPLSPASVALLRAAGPRSGFRSIFRDWVSECTSYPSEVAEMVLAHAVGDKVEAAYRRGDLLSRRMTLMQDAEQFIAGKAVSEVGTISSRVIFGNG